MASTIASGELRRTFDQPQPFEHYKKPSNRRNNEHKLKVEEELNMLYMAHEI